MAEPEPEVVFHVKRPESYCYTLDGFVDPDYAQALWTDCGSLTLIDNMPIRIYGRICHQKRAVGFFSSQSHGYQYSGQLLAAQPLPDFLSKLLETVNRSLGVDFNGILVNLYKDGKDTIGFHSDSEKDLAKGGVVASITLGASRTFKIRPKIPSEEVSIQTKHGQLLVMGGNFQKEFTHGIPAESSVTDPRISLTFRRHLA